MQTRSLSGLGRRVGGWEREETLIREAILNKSNIEFIQYFTSRILDLYNTAYPDEDRHAFRQPIHINCRNHVIYMNKQIILHGQNLNHINTIVCH